MGLFNNLMSKIFGHGPAPTVAAGGTVNGAINHGGNSGSRGRAPQVVDVAVILDGLAAKNAEKLDWKRSIVDLMKLVGMDSSLSVLASSLRRNCITAATRMTPLR